MKNNIGNFKTTCENKSFLFVIFVMTVMLVNTDKICYNRLTDRLFVGVKDENFIYDWRNNGGW